MIPYYTRIVDLWGRKVIPGSRARFNRDGLTKKKKKIGILPPEIILFRIVTVCVYARIQNFFPLNYFPAFGVSDEHLRV